MKTKTKSILKQALPKPYVQCFIAQAIKRGLHLPEIANITITERTK